MGQGLASFPLHSRGLKLLSALKRTWPLEVGQWKVENIRCRQVTNEFICVVSQVFAYWISGGDLVSIISNGSSILGRVGGGFSHHILCLVISQRGTKGPIHATRNGFRCTQSQGSKVATKFKRSGRIWANGKKLCIGRRWYTESRMAGRSLCYLIYKGKTPPNSLPPRGLF